LKLQKHTARNQLHPALIIAPHLDDAAFSLGSALLAGSLGAMPRILVVFSRSNYAIETPGTGDVEVVTQVRKKEEEAAAGQMQAVVEFLDFGEPLVRGACREFHEIFNKDFDPVTDPVFEPVRNKVVNIIDELQPTLAVFPLAIGNHLDHIMLNRIGLSLLAAGGTRVMFFEDQPYAGLLDEEDIVRIGNKLNRNLKPYPIPGVELERKLLLLEIYKSQLNAIDFELVRRYHAVRGLEHMWGM